MRNKIIVVKPKNSNLFKAMYNALMVQLIDIIVLSDIQSVNKICDRMNFNPHLLKIVNCENDAIIFKKLKDLSTSLLIQGIIYDNIDSQIEETIKVSTTFNVINYGVFNKTIFIVNNMENQMTNITEIKNVMANLNINNCSLGIVSNNELIFSEKRKWFKKQFLLKNVERITTENISKCKNNIIIFDNQDEKKDYMKELKYQIMPRYLEIKKASNILMFDAKGMELKNIFYIFILCNKLTTNNKINTQVF